MPDAGSMGMKYQFVLEGGDEGVTLCAVEELALEHYKENGYPEGRFILLYVGEGDDPMIYRRMCCRGIGPGIQQGKWLP